MVGTQRIIAAVIMMMVLRNGALIAMPFLQHSRSNKRGLLAQLGHTYTAGRHHVYGHPTSPLDQIRSLWQTLAIHTSQTSEQNAAFDHDGLVHGRPEPERCSDILPNHDNVTAEYT